MITKVYRDATGKIINIGDWDPKAKKPADAVESTADLIRLADGSPIENTASAYRQLRRDAYLQELGSPVETRNTYDTTIGDILDVIIKHIAGVDVSSEFPALVQKIAAIKARYPKP